MIVISITHTWNRMKVDNFCWAFQIQISWCPVLDPKMRLGTVIVVLTECLKMSIAQGTGQRELFSWTEALNRSGGRQSHEKPLGNLNQVQR